nr:hypothetical protein [Tanacetum cinerariifolium]
MDEALVPSTQRLRIGRSNLRLPLNVQSKESTLQLVYDVLRKCAFFKEFLVTADVLEIYMQEFWATAYVHQQSIRFKINNKKLIVSLESFKEMLHICPRIHGQSFDELPFEEEILDFIRFLGHSATIRTHFVYQVEHKNHKKSNEMYYPRFIKVIIHHFMSKDPSIPRRNKINWHYVRDDSIFSTIKASAKRKKSGSDTSITPPTATITPTQTVVVTPRLNAAAKGKQTAKSLSAPLKVARTEAQQLKIVLRRSRQQTHISQPGGSGIDKGTGADDQAKDEDDDKGDEGDEKTEGGGDDEEEGKSDEDDDNEETREKESFDPIPKTTKSSEDEGDGEEDKSLKIGEEERLNEEEEANELYRDVDINQGRGLQVNQEVEDSHVTLTLINSDGQQESSRRDDDDDQDEGPFAGSDRGSKRRREGKEPESASAPLETTTRSACRSTTGSKSQQASASEYAFEEEAVQTTSLIEEPSHLVFETGSTQTWISELAKQANTRSSFNELLDTPLDFSNFIMNQLRVDTLTPELLAGPTYELIKGSCTSLIELEYHLEEVYKAKMDQLDWVNPEG